MKSGNLGKKLKELRLLMGISQEKLSEEFSKGSIIKFSRHSIMRYEQGEIPPSKKGAIAEAYAAVCENPNITASVILANNISADDLKNLWIKTEPEDIETYFQRLLKEKRYTELEKELEELKGKDGYHNDLYNYYKGASLTKNPGMTMNVDPAKYFNCIDPDNYKFYIKGQKNLYDYYHHIYKDNISYLSEKMSEMADAMLMSGFIHPYPHFIKELTNEPPKPDVSILNYKEFHNIFSQKFNFQKYTIYTEVNEEGGRIVPYDGQYWVEFWATLYFFAVRLLIAHDAHQASSEEHVHKIINEIKNIYQCDIPFIINTDNTDDKIKVGFKNLKHFNLYKYLVSFLKNIPGFTVV